MPLTAPTGPPGPASTVPGPTGPDGPTGPTGPAGGTQLYGAEVTGTQTFSGGSYAAFTTPVAAVLPAVPAISGMTAAMLGFLVTGELSAGDTTDTPGIGVYDSDGDIGTVTAPLVLFNTKTNLGSGVFRQFGSIPSTNNSGAVFSTVTHIPVGLIHHWATSKGSARTYSLSRMGGGTTTTFSVKNLRLWVLTYA
jgi:hypothetical protein